MTYKELINYLIEGVSRSLSDGAKVSFLKIPQINRESVDVLRVIRQDQAVSPAICIKDYWNRYSQQHVEPELLLREIINIYDISARIHNWPENGLDDYSEAKIHLYPLLINPMRNHDLLETIPHRPFLDLEIVSAVFYSSPERTMSMSIVSNRQVNEWGISKSRLITDTIENLHNLLQPIIVPIEEMIASILEARAKGRFGRPTPSFEDCLEGNISNTDFPDDYDMITGRKIFEQDYTGHNIPITDDKVPYDYDLSPDVDINDCNPMFVMTNKLHHYGACAALDTERIARFADDLDSDLYIFPSSIHEIIIIKKDKSRLEYFLRMVRKINACSVRPDDWLSDEIYEWNREEQILTFARLDEDFDFEMDGVEDDDTDYPEDDDCTDFLEDDCTD